MNQGHRGVAVVTGAASGIGWATAEVLRDDGYVVVAVDLLEPSPSWTAGAGHAWVVGDVTDQTTWDRVVATCLGHDPAGATCFASCAGMLLTKPFLETSMEEWKRVFDVNVGGTIRGMQALMPGMLERGSGSIAVICSVASFFVEEGLAAYVTAKAALLHVVRVAALEHAQHGLRINAVCPGAVDTPMFRSAVQTLDTPNGDVEAVLSRTPTGKLLLPEEVAAVVRFLVSAEASGLSGAAVTVDGGLTTTYDFTLSSPR